MHYSTVSSKVFNSEEQPNRDSKLSVALPSKFQGPGMQQTPELPGNQSHRIITSWQSRRELLACGCNTSQLCVHHSFEVQISCGRPECLCASGTAKDASVKLQFFPRL